ncbi:putative Cytochrome P450 [Seiridium cardinale]
MASAGHAALGMSQAGTDLLRKDIMGDSNPIVGLMPIMARVMAPGPSLNGMVRKAAEVMATSIDNLRQDDGVSTMKFYEWTRHEILMATTEAVFGPKNPYRDPVVESAWRTFEPSYLSLAISPLKPLTAPHAFRARETLASSFVSYLEDNGPETASPFIRAAHKHNVSHGFTTEDLARFEVGHTHAINGSTAPSTWWLLWHVYSDPVVLGDVRGELESLVVDSSPDLHAKKTRTFDLSLLPTHTPILHSTLKETLRVHTMATAVRLCLEDHLLEGKYLLKKGGLVIVPQPLHHSSTVAWGEDADRFNHQRFLSRSERTGREANAQKGKGYDNVAFRAFGGGHTLCPGRHFSTIEILAFAAMMVLRFDVEPSTGDRWVKPTWEKTPIVASLHIPDEDVEVRIKSRDSDGTSWQFVI